MEEITQYPYYRADLFLVAADPFRLGDVLTVGFARSSIADRPSPSSC